MADKALKGMADAIAAHMDDLKRFLAMAGVSDPRIAETMTRISELVASIQTATAEPVKKEPVKPAPTKAADEKKK